MSHDIRPGTGSAYLGCSIASHYCLCECPYPRNLRLGCGVFTNCRTITGQQFATRPRRGICFTQAILIYAASILYASTLLTIPPTRSPISLLTGHAPQYCHLCYMFVQQLFCVDNCVLTVVLATNSFGFIYGRCSMMRPVRNHGCAISL
jgi:hypothetical protein